MFALCCLMCLIVLSGLFCICWGFARLIDMATGGDD